MQASQVLLTIKTNTKEEEKEILNGFLKRLNYSDYSETPNEQPDFIINLCNQNIGVEITKYYSDYTSKGSRAQQKIAEWKKFAEGLKSKLVNSNKGLIYLYGSIHFS